MPLDLHLHHHAPCGVKRHILAVACGDFAAPNGRFRLGYGLERGVLIRLVPLLRHFHVEGPLSVFGLRLKVAGDPFHVLAADVVLNKLPSGTQCVADTSRLVDKPVTVKPFTKRGRQFWVAIAKWRPSPRRLSDRTEVERMALILADLLDMLGDRIKKLVGADALVMSRALLG